MARPNSAADGSTQISPKGRIPLFPTPTPCQEVGTGDGNAAVLFNRRERHPMPRFEHADRRTRTEISNMTSFNAERVARRHSCRLATVVGSLRLRPSSEQVDTARES